MGAQIGSAHHDAMPLAAVIAIEIVGMLSIMITDDLAVGHLRTVRGNFQRIAGLPHLVVLSQIALPRHILDLHRP